MDVVYPDFSKAFDIISHWIVPLMAWTGMLFSG